MRLILSHLSGTNMTTEKHKIKYDLVIPIVIKIGTIYTGEIIRL